MVARHGPALQGCDVLVHMRHCLSGTELGPESAQSCMGHLELAWPARDGRVGTVVLTHVTEQIDRPGVRVRERVIREMAAMHDGDIVLGEDLMVVPVGRPQAAKLLCGRILR